MQNLIANLEDELKEIIKSISEKEPVVPMDLIELKDEYEKGIKILKIYQLR